MEQNKLDELFIYQTKDFVFKALKVFSVTKALSAIWLARSVPTALSVVLTHCDLFTENDSACRDKLKLLWDTVAVTKVILKDNDLLHVVPHSLLQQTEH